VEEIVEQKVKNFWIIDDDRIFGLLSKRVIEISGIAENIHILSDGSSALDEIQLLLAQSERVPEVIFLDINLPDMSGFEFLAQLEKLPGSERIKVYIFSASITPKDRKEALHYRQVLSIVEKPLTTEKLKVIASQL